MPSTAGRTATGSGLLQSLQRRRPIPCRTACGGTTPTPVFSCVSGVNGWRSAVSLDFPDTPVFGQRFPDPPLTDLPVWTWDGVKWRIVAGGGGGGLVGGVIVSPTATVNPAERTLWFDSTNGKFSLWYD